MEAAEIREILTDGERYMSATATFRSKYKALPGDMKYATRLWGARAGGTADGVDATCQAYYDVTNSPTSATCNGNGNGRIGDTQGAINWVEIWSAWQHLSNAGLIDGIYTGQSDLSTDDAVLSKTGLNAPLATRRGAGYAFVYYGNVTTGFLNYFDGEYGHVIRIGRNTDVDDAFLYAEEMARLDEKIDDGLPAQGYFKSNTNSYRPNCASSDNEATARYLVTNTNMGCNILWNTGF